MADQNNPLNNPDALPPQSKQGPPAPASPEANPELDDFLESVFSPESQTTDDPEPEPAPVATQGQAPPAPSAGPSHQRSADPSPPVSGEPSQASEPPAQPAAPELNQQVMQELLTHLQSMRQPQEPAQPPPQITPEQARQQLKPLVDNLVKTGWISEDMAALYPNEAAAMAYQHVQILQMQQALQQVQGYINQTQQGTQANQAEQGIYRAIDEVASKGDVFEPLKTPEIRKGFFDWIVELNPLQSQITPDFLARQYYAYNHQVIFNTVKQAQQYQAPTRQSRGAKAQQEGGSAHLPPPAQPSVEWADMIAGVLPGL